MLIARLRKNRLITLFEVLLYSHCSLWFACFLDPVLMKLMFKNCTHLIVTNSSLMNNVSFISSKGKQSVNCFRAFGAKPLEDVVKNLKSVIMSELETALSQHAPTPAVDDPNLYELPPIVVDGIPTPVEKMTQVRT